MEKAKQGFIMLERVLLVDDDAISLYIAKRLLKDTVSEPIQTAISGAEALEAVKGWIGKQQLPQLILSDVSMLLTDGVAFIEALEELSVLASERIWIVLLTEKTSFELVQWARQRPHTRIMEKPLTREKVSEILDDLMEA